ncbi:MAG: hypothetical protein IKT31_00700 [Firmicutes bacterium]|nr:hypothetical protein [Bacillota bacterium]
MKLKVKKLIKKLNNSMFDVAAAPLLIVIFGIPILLALAVAGLVYFAVKAVIKISREKKQEERDK